MFRKALFYKNNPNLYPDRVNSSIDRLNSQISTPLVADTFLEKDLKFKRNQRFLRAASEGDLFLIKTFSPVHFNTVTAHGETALILAVKGRHSAVVRYLLKNGAEVGTQDKFGFSALMYAIKQRDKAIVLLLVAQNAEILSRNRAGITPLSVCLMVSNLRRPYPRHTQFAIQKFLLIETFKILVLERFKVERKIFRAYPSHLMEDPRLWVRLFSGVQPQHSPIAFAANLLEAFARREHHLFSVLLKSLPEPMPLEIIALIGSYLQTTASSRYQPQMYAWNLGYLKELYCALNRPALEIASPLKNESSRASSALIFSQSTAPSSETFSIKPKTSVHSNPR